MKIKFLLRSAKNPAQIYIRVMNGRRFDISAPTSLFINHEDWNPEKGIPRRSSDINESQLNKIKAKILAVVNDENQDIVYDASWLRELCAIKKESKASIVHSPDYLVNHFDAYIEKVKSKIKLGKLNKTTAGKYERTRDIVIAMQGYYNKKYKVKDVGLDFIEEFEEYAYQKEKYAENYVGRIIKFIKTVVRDARVSGIETHPQLDSIKGYTTKTAFVVLTEEEIENIKAITLPKDHKINDARDWLLISCYTGQRISDFLRFNSNMIKEINDPASDRKVKVINFTQEKTGKEIDFPISSDIAMILDKREGEFPKKMSDQEYNKLIKEVCKIAGLTQVVYGGKEKPSTKRKEWGNFPKYELITSHVGRRSFCTNKYGKVPTPFIMYASGHSTEVMLLKYINKTNAQNTLELAKYLN